MDSIKWLIFVLLVAMGRIASPIPTGLSSLVMRPSAAPHRFHRCVSSMAQNGQEVNAMRHHRGADDSRLLDNLA